MSQHVFVLRTNPSLARAPGLKNKRSICKNILCANINLVRYIWFLVAFNKIVTTQTQTKRSSNRDDAVCICWCRINSDGSAERKFVKSITRRHCAAYSYAISDEHSDRYLFVFDHLRRYRWENYKTPAARCSALRATWCVMRANV